MFRQLWPFGGSLQIEKFSFKSCSFIAVCIFLGLPGCTSLTRNLTQEIEIKTIGDNRELFGISCTAATNSASIELITPAKIIIPRSAFDLVVDCKNSIYAGREIVSPSKNGLQYASLMLGNVAGFLVDTATAVGYDFPPLVIVFVRKSE